MLTYLIFYDLRILDCQQGQNQVRINRNIWSHCLWVFFGLLSLSSAGGWVTLASCSTHTPVFAKPSFAIM